MTKPILPKFIAIVGLACLLLAGCSGDHSGNSTVPANIQDVSLRASDVVDRTITLLLDGGMAMSHGAIQAAGSSTSTSDLILQQGDINVTVPCGQGHITVTGNVHVEELDAENRVTVSATLTFTNCDGIEGNMLLENEGAVSQSHMTFNMTLDGSIEVEGCTIAFDQFATDTTANGAGLLTAAILATGSIHATCGATRIDCALSDMDLDDWEALGNSCKAS